MRITKQKLINLIKEELANEVSLDEVTPAKIPGLPAVGGAAAKPDATSAVNVQELVKLLIQVLKDSSTGEDNVLAQFIRAFGKASKSGMADTNSAVKRNMVLLMKALGDMTKDPEPEAKPEEEPEKKSTYVPRQQGTYGRDYKVGGGAPGYGRKTYQEGKVTKNALEGLIKEAVAELINK